MRPSILAVLLVACGGKGEPTAPTPTVPLTTTTITTTQEFEPGFLVGQYCNVRAIFEVGCVTGCHSAIVPEAGLDLQTDPYQAIVGVPAQNSAGTLVIPGNPQASVLYLKMAGLQALDQGGVMPPQGPMDPYFLVPIRDWILAGAPNDCVPGYEEETYTEPEPGQPYHPPGWTAPDVHGLAANLQTDGDCRSCHGAQLDGGTAGVSCDTCHDAGWRTDCTFCHGGTVDLSGAPPEDIDNQTNPFQISFRAHQAHVDGDDHQAYDCVQCHSKPSDVLTPGHVFDDYTAGYGELDYTGGLAPIATYYQGTCSNVYCHGDGQVTGQATDGQGEFACYGCHYDISSTPADWNQMSGRHKQHLDEAITCSECHSSVVDAAQVVIQPSYHVDGTVQVLPIGTDWVGQTCSGTCHGHNHDNENW